MAGLFDSLFVLRVVRFGNTIQLAYKNSLPVRIRVGRDSDLGIVADPSSYRSGATKSTGESPSFVICFAFDLLLASPDRCSFPSCAFVLDSGLILHRAILAHTPVEN